MRVLLRLLLLLALGAGAMAGAQATPPTAHAGLLDLRGWNAGRDGPVELRGEWSIVWGDRFAAPAADFPASAARVAVPGPWNALPVPGGTAGPQGYASYGLTIACSQAPSWALLIPNSHAAMRVYVNGQLVARQGEPGTTEASTQPKVATTLATLPPSGLSCPVRIVAHVANFSHRHGGMVRAIRLGDAQQLAAERSRNIATDIALMGAFGVMGLLPLLFFAIRRRETPVLWFGLFCWCTAVYIGFARERVLQHLFLDIGWEAYLKFEYLGWYLAGPCMLLFARGWFPREFDRRVVAVILACILLPSLLVLLGPARLYSHTVPFVQAVAVVLALYLTAGTALAAWRRRPSARVLLGGIAILGLAVILDILQYRASLHSTLTPYGVLAFALAPAFVLTQRFAQALTAEELRAVEQRHRVNLLVRATRAGIVDWDASTEAVRFSDRYLEILGLPAKSGRSSWVGFFDQVWPEDRERVRLQVQSDLAAPGPGGSTREHAPLEFRLTHALGHAVWVRAEALSLLGADGRALRTIFSLIDVTALREMQESLARQNEMLKDHVRLREEMERMGRHDLKTPLNSIIAVPRLLRAQGGIAAEDEELLRVVERAGLRLLGLVNLSLDLYKMEQGSYRLRPRPVDLRGLLDAVFADVASQAESKSLTLHVMASKPAPPTAWAEELLCYSILANLVKNAVEAAPPHSTITARLEAGERLALHLHNQGAVPQALRGRFFQKYASAGKEDGTGLGAYSAHLMARVQDGELSMRSSDDAGTTLTLLLPKAPEQPLPSEPAAHAAPATVGPTASAALPAARVLVADDDEFNLLLMRRHLAGAALEVRTAVNGRAALAQALQWQPQLVFMDLEMPVLSGLEAIRELRRLAGPPGPARCAIGAWSSHDDHATRQSALEAGADLYLVKPVAQDALLGALGALLAPAEPHPPWPRIDPELADAIPGFLVSRRQLVAAMANAAERGDWEEARRKAHQLAGSLAMYGFDWAGERCRQLEQAAGAQDRRVLREGAAEVDRHLNGVERELAP